MLENTDVVILCGGLGTRLRSVDADTPKVMMSFQERPFLDILIQELKKEGSRRFILCTGYKSDWIEEFYKQNNPGATIVYSREEKPLGTGGAIKNAKEHIQSDSFFVLNGDCYCDVSFKEFYEYHQNLGASGTLVASYVPDSKDYGTMEMDESDRILAFLEKEDKGAAYINAGRYCLNREVFDLMPEEEKFSIEYDVFPVLVKKGLFGFKHKGVFFDIGTPERYNKAIEFFQERDG